MVYEGCMLKMISFSGLRTAAFLFGASLLALSVAGCDDSSSPNARATKPVPAATIAMMNKIGSDQHAATLIRTFKKEAEFEVWKQKPDGTYAYLKTFPMCRWSGQLGPKVREGDRQVPEGFYGVTPAQMNPNSSYYLSFNVGYPNALDRSLGHTGGAIMVHGICSSAGCYSMTDAQISEIYAIARESFNGGQHSIQMQSFPFRMTAENLAKHRLDQNMPFWRNLKEGSDHFEVTKAEPAVGVCGHHYVFDAKTADGTPLDAGSPCPALKTEDQLASAVSQKQAKDNEAIAELVAKGVQPIKLVYQDGGQHPDFRNKVAEMSRPEAIAELPTEVVLNDPKSKTPPIVQAVAKTTVPATTQPVDKTVLAATSALPDTNNAMALVQTGPTSTFQQTAKVEKPFYKKFLPFGDDAEAVAEQPTPALANVPLPPKRP